MITNLTEEALDIISLLLRYCIALLEVGQDRCLSEL